MPDETQNPSADDAGDDKNHIEMPPDYVGRINIGYPRPVSEDEAREKELPEGGEIEMPPDYVGRAGAEAAHGAAAFRITSPAEAAATEAAEAAAAKSTAADAAAEAAFRDHTHALDAEKAARQAAAKAAAEAATDP